MIDGQRERLAKAKQYLRRNPPDSRNTQNRSIAMKWYLIYEGLPITYGERIKDGKGNEFKLISFDEPPKCNLRVVDSMGNHDVRPAEEFPVKFVQEEE